MVLQDLLSHPTSPHNSDLITGLYPFAHCAGHTVLHNVQQMLQVHPAQGLSRCLFPQITEWLT